VDVIVLDVLDQTVQGLVQVSIVDSHGVLIACAGVGAERQQERVVLDRLASLGMQRVLAGVDPRQLLFQQRRADVAGDPLEWVAAGRTVGERLTDDHRAVDELEVRCDEGHVGELRREVGERQRALERGYSSTDDDHSKVSSRGPH
jgi:hypothetical protein